MEDPHSVSSPRRILSLSKKRRATISFPDAEEKASGFGMSGEHGPKPLEVYGFVGSITTVAATATYLPHRLLLSREKKDGMLCHDLALDYKCCMDLTVNNAIFLVWAYVPEGWLHSIGVFYYPSRYWALAVPAYLMVTVALALGFYLGLNFMSTPSPTSLNTMLDEFSREPSGFVPLVEDGEEQPIEPISDIGLSRINDLMFNNGN